MKYISENTSKKIAIIGSLLIHLIILYIHIPILKEKIVLNTVNYRIPVQMTITKPKPQPKIENPNQDKSSGKQNAKAAANAQARAKAAEEAKPSRLPGDRDHAVVSQEMAPVYPKAALNQELTGNIKLKITVSPKGKPIDIDVIRSSGHTILDESFMNTIKHYYLFKPKRVMGKNVKSTIILEHTFTLE